MDRRRPDRADDFIEMPSYKEGSRFAPNSSGLLADSILMDSHIPEYNSPSLFASRIKLTHTSYSLGSSMKGAVDGLSKPDHEPTSLTGSYCGDLSNNTLSRKDLQSPVEQVTSEAAGSYRMNENLPTVRGAPEPKEVEFADNNHRFQQLCSGTVPHSLGQPITSPPSSPVWHSGLSEATIPVPTLDSQCTYTDDPHLNPLSSNAFEPSIAAPADSGYRTGAKTGTASVYSIDSVERSLGPPRSFLQDFIAFFGAALIQKSEARQWIDFALANRTLEEFESQLEGLIENYTEKKVSFETAYWTSKSAGATKDERKIIAIFTSTNNLIQRYRRKIARYVRQNAASALTNVYYLEEDDDSDEDPEMKALFADIESLRDELISSYEFCHLAHTLEVELAYYDKVGMPEIDFLLSRENLKVEVGSGDYESLFTLRWSVGDFLQFQYDSGISQIGTVVVLTGSALNAQATTCAEYVARVWPETGAFFLKLLDALFSLSSGEQIGHVRDKWVASSELGLFVKAEKARACSFYIRSRKARHISELAQQLAWASCALSVSPYGNHLAITEASLQKRSSRNFKIAIKHIRVDRSEKACWLPLFCGAAIASNFPIPERAEEKGLEISLELLAALSGVEHAVEYEGGVVMKSFSHMFVPQRKNANCVQWHAIMSSNPENRLTYQDGISRCGSRALLHEVSLHDLSTSRAIVGWCTNVESRLGSHLATYENIDFSKAEEAGTSIECSGASIGFQQFGAGAFDFRLSKKHGKFHFSRDGPLRKILSAAEKTPVVLHDTGEKRAWLVPASEVMLHMVQHRHHLEPFTVDGKRIDLDTTITAESSAKDIILKNRSLQLYEDGHSFEKEICRTWSLLELCLDQGVQKQSKAGKTLHGTLRKYLQGFEFNDIVQERSPVRFKEKELSKTCGEWPQFVCDIDAIVLLADGFEDLLVPSAEGNSGLCRRWNRVPKDLDYLATSTKMLLQLYNEAGSRLERKYLTSTSLMQWHQGNSILFDACGNPGNCECDRLQQLFQKSAMGNIVCPKLIPESAAVIFGRSSLDVRSKCHHQSPELAHIYSQTNGPLSPSFVYSECADSPSSDGTSQTWSKSPIIATNRPTSSDTSSSAENQETPRDATDTNCIPKTMVRPRKRRLSVSTKLPICDVGPNCKTTFAESTRKRIRSYQEHCTMPLSLPNSEQKLSDHDVQWHTNKGALHGDLSLIETDLNFNREN